MREAQTATAHRPDERPGGAVVGPQVTLRYATQTLRFRSDDPRVMFFLHHAHEPFRVADTEPADCQLVWRVEPVEPSPGQPLRASRGRWELRRLPDGREESTFFHVPEDGGERRPTMQLVSDPDFRTIEVRQAPRARDPFVAYASEYPWDEYVLQRRLGISGGAIVHASVAVFEGRGHLFVGHSGAGKSTIAELAEQAGATIPTDDRVVLTATDDGIMAWGTPWHGSFKRKSRDGALLASLSLLVQDTVDRLEPISPARTVKELFVRTVQSRVTDREVHNTLDTLERVAHAVPCFELRFRPTVDAVRLVFDAVRNRASDPSR
jgi:hypothetical protein